MLQIFTLSYPDSGSDCPLVMVLFTNFSASETSENSGDFSFDEEDEVEKLQDINSSNDSVTFPLLIDKFREDLVTKLIEDQSIKSKI